MAVPDLDADLDAGAAGRAGPLTLPAPRSRTGRQGRTARTNFELYSWLFMRGSGLLLVFLVLGHLLVMNILDGGVHRINFAFVAGRWSSPFWQTWDLLQLWLAELHSTRFWLKMLLYTSAVVVLFLGTLVIFTFDPNLS